jgi:hypothetical protein
VSLFIFPLGGYLLFLLSFNGLRSFDTWSAEVRLSRILWQDRLNALAVRLLHGLNRLRGLRNLRVLDDFVRV